MKGQLVSLLGKKKKKALKNKPPHLAMGTTKLTKETERQQ